jgi:hypothetical protein
MVEKEGANTRPKARGTPSKVAGGTGRLSVPQPGTNPPLQREDEMEADEIIRFPELMKKETWNRTDMSCIKCIDER